MEFESELSNSKKNEKKKDINEVEELEKVVESLFRESQQTKHTVQKVNLAVPESSHNPYIQFVSREQKEPEMQINEKFEEKIRSQDGPIDIFASKPEKKLNQLNALVSSMCSKSEDMGSHTNNKGKSGQKVRVAQATGKYLNPTRFPMKKLSTEDPSKSRLSIKKKNRLLQGERGSLRRGRPKQKQDKSLELADQVTHVASEKLLSKLEIVSRQSVEGTPDIDAANNEEVIWAEHTRTMQSPARKVNMNAYNIPKDDTSSQFSHAISAGLKDGYIEKEENLYF